MASRRDTLERKTCLRDDLRKACQDSRLAQGEPVTPVRELGQRYGVSGTIVRQVLQQLIDEGCLYTVPRVGTFVGPPTAAEAEHYLMLQPDDARSHEHYLHLQSAFEERISALGGVSLTMDLATALACRAEGRLPGLAGLFDFAYRQVEPERCWGHQAGIARVAFGVWVEDPLESDVVTFDNVGGGRQATQHLLALGHRQIAYLATHATVGYPGWATYSAEREEGWRDAMRGAGLSCEDLAVHPLASPGHDHAERVKAIRAIARGLLTRVDVTAVITADSRVTRGLFLSMGDLKLPVERWPAVVSFGNELDQVNSFVTEVRLPWDEIGRAAADVLWERVRQRLTGCPVTRRVPTRMIPRLTSAAGWAVSASPTLLAGAVSEAAATSRPALIAP